MNNYDHEHQWRKLYEEFLLGGAFAIGWECTIPGCDAFVSNDEITPKGLPGYVLEKAMRLVGPHGGRGRTSKGGSYKEQIVDDNGKLTIHD